MSNFLVAVQAVAPLFFYICIGLLVRKFNIMSLEDAKRTNKLVFTVFLSTTLFYNIYTANMGEVFQPKLIIFVLGTITVCCFLWAAVLCKFVKDNKTRGAMLQAIYRSNFVIMGAPLVANLFGTDRVPVTIMLVAIVVPFYNLTAVIILETFRGKGFSLKTIAIGIAHNPLIRGAILGVIFSLLNITLPKIIIKSIADVVKGTTPLALIILGASFQPVTNLSNYKHLAVCLIGKLLIMPAIGLSAAWFLGYRGMELATLIAIFGTPTAVSSYAMAQQMNSDTDLTANAIVFSSGFACITMFCWVFLFTSLGAF